MKLGRKPLRTGVDEENPYWMSFSDIMSGLLVIFILASVILILQLMLKQREIDETRVKFEDEIALLKKAEEVRRNILIQAAEELHKRGIRVELNENATILRIPNHLLGFDTGSDEIKPEFQDTAYEIGEVLQSLIVEGDRADYLDTIFVEGHTDSRPFKRSICGEKGNWCLSSFRAISLWLFWESALPEGHRLGEMNNLDGHPLFSVSGYAASRPVVTDEVSEDDFASNRRIDIRFTIRRPTSAEYQAVRDSLKVVE